MSTDLPFLSYLGTLQYLTNTSDMINKSVKQVNISKQYGAHLTSNFQWPGAVFRVPDLFQWVVVTTGSKHIEDVYKAPDSVLSFMDAVFEVSLISKSCSVCKTAHRHIATPI